MFRKYRIGTRLLASFLMVSAITAVVGGVGYWGLHRTAEDIREIGEVRLPSVQTLLITKERFNDIKAVQRTILNPQISKEERQRLYDSVVESRKVYNEAIKRYEPFPQTEEEAKLWKEFVPALAQRIKDNGELFNLVRKVDDMAAVYYTTPRSSKLSFDKAIDLAGETIHHANFELLKIVQTWKNILIRSENPVDFDKHWSEFQNLSKNFQTLVQEIVLLSKDLGVAVEQSQDLQTHLQESLAKYREALKSYNRDNPKSYQLVDQQVRGLDRIISSKLNTIKTAFDQFKDQVSAIYAQAENQALKVCAASEKND